MGHFWPTRAADFNNRAEGGIYTQRYEMAKIWTRGSNTPPSSGVDDQIPTNFPHACRAADIVNLRSVEATRRYRYLGDLDLSRYRNFRQL